MCQSLAEERLEVLQVYRLLQYVHEGNTTQMERLLHRGVPGLINLTEPQEGNCALHLASVANCLDMVNFLLSQGGHPDVQDKKGRTAVMRAAELGHDAIVALLANSDANMKAVDSEGRGVLFYCLSPTKRHMRCLDLALDHMADVNNVSFVGKPVLLLACEQAQDCESMCIALLQRGADPNATNQTTGRTPLMEAARAGALELVRAILQTGGNPNALDKKRMHAAHFAAMGGFFEVIRVLSAYSADLGIMAADGNTPLHYAAQGGFSECCRFLAQRGCNPKLKNYEGLLPRQIAKDNGHKQALNELKKAERLHSKFSKPGAVNPNEQWTVTLHDWSCEHEAVLMALFAEAEDTAISAETVSKETFISILQKRGAPVDIDQLHAVVSSHDKKRDGQINLSEFFKGLKYLHKTYVISSYSPKRKKSSTGSKGKKKGKLVLPMPICTLPPELIQRREDGGPPHFMIESYQQFTDTSRFSRDHPPAHAIEDDSAWYVDEPEKIYVNINYCVKTGDMESLLLAFRQGVPLDVKDRYYKTPLITACVCGSYQVAKFLISLGADVNACDQFNWTPLHHACHAGQLDVIELLVQAGAMVDVAAWNGATPLMRAIESCRLSCVDYLLKAGAKVQAQNKKEQNCLDIAKVYADFRIVELIQAKFDSLPKSRDNKKGKGNKLEPKPKSAASIRDKGPGPASPVVSEMPVKREAQKESIIFHNSLITSQAANKPDISFVPKTVWGRPRTTSQLIQKKEEWRERHSYEVDFEDFLMPFNRNIMEKSQQLAEPN
nr:ankyrin repeat and EF-hand domain-containing protein 1 [Paramormyrops kingsleyae]